MITKEQALTERTFHKPATLGHETPTRPPKCYVWRRNGQTQTWKTRPDNFKVPVKFGLYAFNYITQDDAPDFYTPADCPACHPQEAL